MTGQTCMTTARWIKPRFPRPHRIRKRINQGHQRLSIGTLLSLLVLSGCVGTPEKLGNANRPTVKQIYMDKLRGKAGTMNRETTHRAIHPDDGDLQGQTRSRYQALNNRFPFLPNPVLVMYVFPHLTSAGTPIPGYATFFKFFAADPVALPHEVIDSPDPIHQEVHP